MRARVLAALRQPSLQWALTTIVLVAVLPTLAVVAATLWRASTSFHEASTRQLLETARTLGQSTMQELELTASVLQHLVQAPVHDAAIMADAHVLTTFGEGLMEQHLVQRDAQGQWQLHNDGQDSPAVQQLVELAAQTGRMQLSNLIDDASVPGGPGVRVVLAMPQAQWNPQQRQPQRVSTLVVAPQHLLHGLARHENSDAAVILAVTDGTGRILARSVDGERFIGQRVPDWPRLYAQPGQSGSLTAQTLEGSSIVFAFQRMAGTPGWVAVVGEAAESLAQRSGQPLRVMLRASVVTVVLALLLAWLLARRVLQPIDWLVARAQRIAAGDAHSEQPRMADMPTSRVAEFEVLRQSLDQADQVLRRSLDESQRAGQQAQEHLAVLQAAEEQARIGHWTLDAATLDVQCSDMISTLFGGPRQATVLHLEELRSKLQPESFARMHAAMQQCLQHGTPYALEIEHLRADGSTFSAYLRGWAVHAAQGEISGIAGTLQDISEGKEQHERLTALADNLPSGVIFRLQRHPDQRLVLEFLSAGLQPVTGLSASAVLQQPGVLLRAMAPVALRRLLRVLQQATQAGHVLDQEFALRTPHGTEVWIHCRAALRYPGTGGAVWDGIARDVTLQRAADAALHAAKEAAERAERAKSDFLATMSHEIRTPMNSVIGMARLALRTPLDARQRNYLEKINTSANVLLGIINDVLDFSRIEAGGMALEHAPLRLEAVLESVGAVTLFKAEEKGLEMTYAVAADVPPVVLGDALRLGQVLTNLVGNAVKFTEQGDVVVRVERRPARGGLPEQLHFAVSDTGIGLSSAQVSQLFQPFTQAGADTSRRYGGTGLGLAISKRLVEMMGGQLGVHSVPGQGSTFYFTLPLQPVDSVAEGQPGSARSLSLRGQRILIADDNRMARMALADMAQGFGMHTVLARDGQEALQLLRSHAAQGQPFDVVVLDWQMPQLDGVQAARHIRSDGQLDHMPAVLMVTAYSQEAMLQACEGLQLQGVLLKPVTPSVMFNTLLQARALAPDIPASGVPASGMPGPGVQALPVGHTFTSIDLQPFAALQGLRVLVADDNALNREVATDFLREVGVQVLTAVDGQDALQCLAQHPVDAVLMDIHMPQLDGLAATRAIRADGRWPGLPVIALTAQARSEDMHSSLAAGMDGHLSKPIDEMALYQCLLQHCRPAQVLAQSAQGTAAAAVPDPAEAGAAATAAIPAFARLSRSPQRRAQLLRGFLQDTAALPAQWQALLAQAQWLPLAELTHRIKGSAAYLDAQPLLTLGEQMEAAARQADAAQVHALAPHWLQALQDCLQAVRDALAKIDQAGAHGALAAPPDLAAQRQLLARAQPLVASGNFAATAVLEQLLHSAAQQPWADAVQAACDAFADLEYAQALAHLEQVAQQLSSAPDGVA